MIGMQCFAAGVDVALGGVGGKFFGSLIIFVGVVVVQIGIVQVLVTL
jgi:hypothetical protein